MSSNMGCLSEVLYIYEPCKVLICLICHSAVCLSTGAEGHFRRHKFVGEKLRQILDFVASQPVLSDPLNAPLPADGSAPVDGLQIAKVYSCSSCRYLEKNRTCMSAHRGQHKALGPARPGWTQVSAQTFIRGRYTRYWVVSTTDDSRQSDEDRRAMTREAGSILDAVQRCESALAEADRERQRLVEAPGGVDREDAWVKYVEWSKHLQGKDKSVLSSAGKLPSARAVEARLRSREAIEANRRLRRLTDSFDRELTRSLERLDSVPKDTLKWLNSIDPSRPHGDPFRLKQNAGSMEWYATCWQRYLCYCVRVFPLGRDPAEEEHGACFTDQQWSQLEQLVAALDAAIQVSPETNPDPDSDEDDPLQAALDRAVFVFCVGSIRQRLSTDAYRSPLLHFTSVLGITPSSLQWTAAHTHTRYLAGFLWAGRVLILEHHFEDAPEDPDCDAAFELLEGFQEQCRQWLTQGSFSPFSNLIGWMSFGRGYRNRETGLARLVWDEAKKTLNLLGERFRVADFQRMAQTAVREAADALDAVAFGQWAALSASVDLPRLTDTVIMEGSGRSFATNKKNAWLEPGAHKLALLAGSALWRQTEGPGGATAGQIRPKAAAVFVQRLRRFRLALFVCVHIWGGQPGRGPEVATLKHCDTEQLPRNVYVYDGRILIITDRDKNKSIRGIGRKVARFLPENVSRMMVAYIAWVLPFERVLHKLSGLRGPSDEDWPWLWRDGRKGVWKSEHLSEQLDLLSSAELGVRLTVSSYRHVAIALGREIRGLVVEQIEMEGLEKEGEEDEFVDPYTGEPLEHTRFEYLWDLQATHGSRTARSQYALQLLYPNELQPEMILNYLSISRLWHAFLELSDGSFARKRPAAAATTPHAREPGKKLALLSSPVPTAPATPAARTAGSTPQKRSALVGPTPKPLDVDAGLRLLFGPDAAWKSEDQREGMVQIAGLRDSGERGEALIMVLPTGGGKSILFMLPARAEDDSVSVVVVPFVALADDLVERAQQMGVDCVRWQPAHATGREGRERDTRLVVVSADVAVSDEFSAYLASFQDRGLLRRIYLDECHTIVTDVNYRGRLQLLAGVHRFGCPLVMLTATLPPAMEQRFRETMLADDAKLLRTTAAKLNARYRVEVVKPGKRAIEGRVLALMQQLEAGMGSGQKGVVYCRSRRECESLAEQAGCGQYHRGQADDERKPALEEWAEGRSGSRWITATSALGTGVDIPGITAVLHARTPYGLVDFVQQTGRGGRQRGELVQSVIVTDGRPVEFPDYVFDDDMTQANRAAMAEFMETPGCRRDVLGRFMDGAPARCSNWAECAPCDRCSPEGAPATCETIGPGRLARDGAADVSRWAGHTKAEGKRLRKLKAWLGAALEGNCMVCRIHWHLSGRDPARAAEHEHEQLSRSCPQLSQRSFDRWRQPLQFADFRCCVECGLPFDWCEEAREGGKCVYRNVVLPIVLMASRHPDIRLPLEAKFGVRCTAEEFIKWAVRSRALYSRSMTNALAVWDWVVQELWKG